MRRIVAIAGMTMRTAIRSRLLMLAAGGVALAVFGLPAVLHGDGTLGGHVQLLLYYPLGLSGLLLSLGAVWAGAAMVAVEVDRGTAALLVTKPVRPIELWLGKWLGLLVWNSVILMLAGLVTGLFVFWSVRGPGSATAADREQVEWEALAAHAEIKADPEPLKELARREFERLSAERRLPTHIPKELLMDYFRERAAAAARMALPGSRKEWTFRPAFRLDSARPALLRFRFVTSGEAFPPAIRGVWEVGAPGVQPYRYEGVFKSDQVGEITVPGSVLSGDGPLTVAFLNNDPASVPVVFAMDSPVTLRLYGGSFEGKALRCLLLMLLRLAVLSALGLTAGCACSFPVAAFVTISLFVVMTLSGWIQGWSDPGQAQTGLQGMSFADVSWYEGIAGVSDTLLFPLRQPGVLESLASGRAIPGRLVLGVLALSALYVLLLAAIGGVILRRRQLIAGGVP